jgi:phosphoserine phosphatase
MSLQHKAYADSRNVSRTPELPADLLDSIFEIEKLLAHSETIKKIAAFDLDNTLLVGDIGEAVFVALKLRGYLPGFSWEKYRRLLSSSKIDAYCSVVSAMSGLSERNVHRVTLGVLSRRDRYLEVEKSLIPVPYAHPVMVPFVSYLRLIGYQIHVISASNEISARLAAWHYFEISPSNVSGIRQRHHRGTLTDELLEPVPVGDGKVSAYRKFIGTTDPIITGGDSPLDVPMLELTDPRGLCLWVGEDKVTYEIIRRKMDGTDRLHFLQRPTGSEFDEESSDD